MNLSTVHKARLFVIGIICVLIFHPQWMTATASAETADRQTGRVAIHIRANNIVNKDQILLGDIAEVRADPFLIDTIRRIEIGPSPDPDSLEVLEKRRILQKIQSQRYLPGNMVVNCPDNVYVKRPGQKLTEQEIEAFLIQKLSERFGADSFRLEKVTARGLEAYPEGDFTFSVDSKDLVGSNGRITGHLDVYVDTVFVDRVSISAELAVFETILFAARSISRGEILTAGDVYEKTVNIHDHNSRIVMDKTSVEGKILRVSLRRDQPFRSSYMEDPPMVRKGDLVTLVASSGNLKIITRGVSKEDGYENDLIRVENFQSGKLVRGVVKEKLQVEVVY